MDCRLYRWHWRIGRHWSPDPETRWRQHVRRQDAGGLPGVCCVWMRLEYWRRAFYWPRDWCVLADLLYVAVYHGGLVGRLGLCRTRIGRHHIDTARIFFRGRLVRVVDGVGQRRRTHSGRSLDAPELKPWPNSTTSSTSRCA